MDAVNCLKSFLRVYGVLLLLAIPAIFLPLEWMDRIHQMLGLGDLPTAPIVSYLARSASALFALFGALTMLIASDLKRYWPLVTFWAIANITLGIVAIGIDLTIPMPMWWVISEGPVLIGLGGFVLWLQRLSKATVFSKHPE